MHRNENHLIFESYCKTLNKKDNKTHLKETPNPFTELEDSPAEVQRWISTKNQNHQQPSLSFTREEGTALVMAIKSWINRAPKDNLNIEVMRTVLDKVKRSTQ